MRWTFKVKMKWWKIRGACLGQNYNIGFWWHWGCVWTAAGSTEPATHCLGLFLLQILGKTAARRQWRFLNIPMTAVIWHQHSGSAMSCSRFLFQCKWRGASGPQLLHMERRKFRSYWRNAVPWLPQIQQKGVSQATGYQEISYTVRKKGTVWLTGEKTAWASKT